MIITTRWSDQIQENNIKGKCKFGTYLSYSHAILDKEIQNNGNSWSRQRKIPATQKISEISSSILVRELIVSPHSENPGLLLLKYREYLQKLYSLDTWCFTEQTNVIRSDSTKNRINHTACQIWPTMLRISFALINSSTLKTSKYLNKLVGPRTFQDPFKKHCILYHWVFRFIFHSWFISCPLNISRAFEWTTHMTISSTLKFTNTLPYTWKYDRIDSTELIQKRGFWLAAHNRGAPEFNTLEQRLYK